ncbi:DNA-binding LacI/PurR family transcriptional regulator [Microbacterium sp. W4I4]|uniref:LacI family DNA-binding transcriptional regulator n=1 Tax=Microbacterium sp. W4I4 TaxID=3042295 RepID=UPI00278B29A9|nr:LacI family DNA-binding transcriptional regulator [Microbacterium sp. W4I4]MDQ0615356.1 DNA-binding LacI/PurR family transcriptional regulator [Microbacterium sp. W4I4]
MDTVPAKLPGSLKRRKPVTTRQIAERAGVSRATVSYVINGDASRHVAEATRERVLAAARELGHLPNGPARALRGHQQPSVLILASSFSQGHVMGAYLDAMSRGLTRHGLVTMTTRMARGAGAAEQILSLWDHVSPEVLVVIGGLLPESVRERIQRSHVRLVDEGDAPNHLLVGRMQATHLASLGITEMVYAGPLERDLREYSERSWNGVQEGCEQNGLRAPAKFLVGFDESSLDLVIDECLGRPSWPGLCTHNDDVALRVIARMRMRGLEPGRDIAIIGADDIPAAALELSTVAFKWPQLAAELVADVVQDVGRSPGSHTSKKPEDYWELVERSSTERVASL